MMRFILYRLSKYQDAYNQADSIIDQKRISDNFVNNELPAIIEELERSCGYHGKNAG